MKFVKREPKVGDIVKLDGVNGVRIGTIVQVDGETVRYKCEDRVMGIWKESSIIVGYGEEEVENFVSDETTEETEEVIKTEIKSVKKRK